MTRIQLNDTLKSAVLKMAGGNPGAIKVCTSLSENAENIDPDSLLGAFGPLLLLDTFGIYEENIWGLYKDVCRQDIVKTMAVLRACQIGIIHITDLRVAINNYGKGIDIDQILIAVKLHLPNFTNEMIVTSFESCSVRKEQ